MAEQERSSDFKSPDYLRFRRYSAFAGVALALTVQNALENRHAHAASCSTPNPQAMRATKKLFAGFSRPYITPTKAAKELGLKITPEPKALANLYVQTSAIAEVPYVYTANPQKEILEASDYLQSHGLDLQVGDGNNSLDGLHSPTLEDEKTDMIDDLGEITWDIQYLPSQFIEYSGLKRIVLMYNKKSNVAYSVDNGDTLVWNMAGPPDKQEVNKAIYEAIDYEECPIPANDPGYESLNPRKNIYGPAENHKGLQSLDYYDNTPSNADLLRSAHVQEAIESGDNVTYCKLQDEFVKEEHQMVVASTGGFESLQEDKEEIGAMLEWPNNNYSDLLDPKKPVLRKKAEFLLARLYDARPKLVKYFAAIGGRPIKGEIDCTKY